LKIYDSDIKKEEIERSREVKFLSLSAEERLLELFKLNRLAVVMNGGKPLKIPKGKGIVISKSNISLV